jgi:hypothetical protein
MVPARDPPAPRCAVFTAFTAASAGKIDQSNGGASPKRPSVAGSRFIAQELFGLFFFNFWGFYFLIFLFSYFLIFYVIFLGCPGSRGTSKPKQNPDPKRKSKNRKSEKTKKKKSKKKKR